MPFLLPCTPLLASSPPAQWLMSAPLFSLVVKGSITGLILATLVIVLIWVVEWRNGKVW
ncbi:MULTISPECIES: hypothetical protein [Aphanothece]|uniref:hypothetical protein n=1 Tax=Aphanothece TaxID=1121 RepID=UPI003984DA40